jgi:hypothetical protein
MINDYEKHLLPATTRMARDQPVAMRRDARVYPVYMKKCLFCSERGGVYYSFETKQAVWCYYCGYHY